jgi:hypothetical protein
VTFSALVLGNQLFTQLQVSILENLWRLRPATSHEQRQIKEKKRFAHGI